MFVKMQRGQAKDIDIKIGPKLNSNIAPS